jgi:hypothetical protein
VTEASVTGKARPGAVVDLDDVFLAIRRVESIAGIVLCLVMGLSAAELILLSILLWR